ncbi:MAG: hypothetical protein RI542_07655 [Wenzhouxiangella sp.]|nr:hypothetical protein [Wenzhouxiangella sp.]
MIKTLTKAALPLAIGMAFASSANAFVVNETFTGNYFEGEDKSGRGVIVDIFPDANSDFSNNALVQWFTYRDGEPIWLYATGAIDQNTNKAELDVLEFVGGDFGPEFTADDATSSPWGTATLTFKSCNDVVLEYDGTDGTGTQNLEATTNGNCVVDESFDACPSFATEGTLPGSCIVSGAIESDVTLTNETLWLPQGKVTVADGATLTIEPNTEIVGGTGTATDYVVVEQGGKMIADGTVDNPIIMRGDVAKARGEWGGLAINGYAPLNDGDDAGTAQGEGDSGTYGGDDPFDNSGIYRYLIVSNAGFEFSPDNELNGIAFQGVGSGTTVEYVQVHLNADDGMEPFGGTVNMKNIVLTGHGDDSFDWTSGYQGNVQYALIKQYTDDADRGIEADSNKASPDASPRSAPTLANFTIIGAGADGPGGHGMLLRRGTAAKVANFVITNATESCLDLDVEETFEQAQGDGTSMVNTYLGDCGEGRTANEDGDLFLLSTWFEGQAGNVGADPKLANYLPADDSPVKSAGAVPFQDAFFDNVDFAGAFRDAKSDWTKGWTVGLDRDKPLD